MGCSDEPEFINKHKSITSQVRDSNQDGQRKTWNEQIDKRDRARNGTAAKSRRICQTRLTKAYGRPVLSNDKETADIFSG